MADGGSPPKESRRIWFYQSMDGILGPCSAAEMRRRATSGRITPETLVKKGESGKWLTADRVQGLLEPELWFYQVMGESFGSYSAAEMRQHANTGTITFDTLVRKGEFGEWISADRVRGLLQPMVAPTEAPTPVEVAVPLNPAESIETAIPIEPAASESTVNQPLLTLGGNSPPIILAAFVLFLMVYCVFVSPKDRKTERDSEKILPASEFSNSDIDSVRGRSPFEDDPAVINLKEKLKTINRKPHEKGYSLSDRRGGLILLCIRQGHSLDEALAIAGALEDAGLLPDPPVR